MDYVWCYRWELRLGAKVCVAANPSSLEANRIPQFLLTRVDFVSTLKQGDTVTYDGTDFLVLNSCTGLIDEVHSAQDLVTFLHNLVLTGITV